MRTKFVVGVGVVGVVEVVRVVGVVGVSSRSFKILTKMFVE
jgi:hypothetical protein